MVSKIWCNNGGPLNRDDYCSFINRLLKMMTIIIVKMGNVNVQLTTMFQNGEDGGDHGDDDDGDR